MVRTKFPAIATTSEWLAATTVNGLINRRTATGRTAHKLLYEFRLISFENVERETKRAIGVTGTHWSNCGDFKSTIIWLPKSQIRELINNCWTNRSSRMFLVPTSLIDAKKAKGYEFA